MAREELKREGIFLVSCGGDFVFVTVMSEETPSLKLKPRLPAALADAPPPAASIAAATGSTDAPRLRLKPKLASEATAPTAAPAASTDLAKLGMPPPPAALPEFAEPVPVIKLRPRALLAKPSPAAAPVSETLAAAPSMLTPPPLSSSTAPVAPTGNEGGTIKFKVKPKAAESSPPPPSPGGSGAGGAPPKPKSVPPFPVVAPAPGSGPRPPVAIHIRAPQAKGTIDEEAAAEIVIAPPRRRKKSGIGAQLGGLVLLALAAGGCYLTYLHFDETSLVRAKSQTKAAANSKSGPTSSDTLNAMAAAPGKLIGSAQEAVAKRRGSEQSRVDGILDGRDPSAPGALRTPLPGELRGRQAPAPAVPSMTRVTSSKAIAPGLSVTTEIQASRDASPAFRTFVTEARVTGVYQGSPPRAFINGHLVRVGQTVEEVLEITFDGIDSENRILLFVDRSGARVSKQY